MPKIMIAVDQNGANEALIDFVSRHKWAEGSQFRIITVGPWMPPETQVRESRDLQRWVESTLQERRKLLDHTADEIKKKWGDDSSRYGVETIMLQGQPCEMILELAESWPTDIVLVGSHGRKGLDRFLFGSVSGAIVAHAPCSVIVVKPPTKA